MFNVKEFGARGDRQSNDRTAIQAAIDACTRAGGGTVYVPAGDYLSGTIRLRSHVTLRLDAGATLWTSAAPDDYDTLHDYEKLGRMLIGTLLVAEDAEHIAVVGEGTIHGTGMADFGPRWGVLEMPPFRTGGIRFQGCRHVTIRGVTILYSDWFAVHLQRCETVFIDGITILNNPHRLNSDGIDPDSCRNVHISNCHIVAGDDCIVLKSTEPCPCENVVITNCTLETPCTALKIGTESHGDFRDIHVSNCTARNTSRGIGFYVKDGATVERVTFSNISIEVFEDVDYAKHTIYPIFMDIERRHADSRVGSIRDVTLCDIHIRTVAGILIQGMPESPIENLVMRNVSVRVNYAADYADRHKAVGGTRTTQDERDTKYARLPSYATLAHVKGLTLDNVRVFIAEEAFRPYERSAVCGWELEDAVLHNVHRHPIGEEGQVPIIDLHNCQRILVTDSKSASA